MSEPELFFEDFVAGDVIELGTYEMTEAEIIDFGRRFDPQYFHTDPEAAVDSPFGGLIASGWHTVAAWARLWIDTVVSRADGRGSGGMQEVRWFEPVRPGDSLTATVEILNTPAVVEACGPGDGVHRLHDDQPARPGGDDLPRAGPVRPAPPVERVCWGRVGCVGRQLGRCLQGRRQGPIRRWCGPELEDDGRIGP